MPHGKEAHLSAVGLPALAREGIGRQARGCWCRLLGVRVSIHLAIHRCASRGCIPVLCMVMPLQQGYSTGTSKHCARPWSSCYCSQVSKESKTCNAQQTANLLAVQPVVVVRHAIPLVCLKILQAVEALVQQLLQLQRTIEVRCNISVVATVYMHIDKKKKTTLIYKLRIPYLIAQLAAAA